MRKDLLPYKVKIPNDNRSFGDIEDSLQWLLNNGYERKRDFDYELNNEIYFISINFEFKDIEVATEFSLIWL